MPPGAPPQGFFAGGPAMGAPGAAEVGAPPKKRLGKVPLIVGAVVLVVGLLGAGAVVLKKSVPGGGATMRNPFSSNPQEVRVAKPLRKDSVERANAFNLPINDKDSSSTLGGLEVDEKRLYLITTDKSGSRLTILELSTLNEVAHKELPSRYSFGTLRRIGDRLVYVGTTAGSSPKSVMLGLNPSTGEIAWPEAELDGSYASMVGELGGKVIVSVSAKSGKGGTIVRVDPVTGQVEKRRDVDSSSIFVGATRIFVWDKSDLIVYKNDADLSNEYTMDAGKAGSAVEFGGRVFIAPSDDKGRVVSYTVGGKENRWDVAVGDNAVEALGRLDDSTLLVKQDEKIKFLNVADGKEKDQSLSASADAVVINGSGAPKVLAKKSDGDKYVLSDGSNDKTVNVKQKTSGEAYADGVLYAYLTEDEKVAAYDIEKEGARLWTWSPPDDAGSVFLFAVDDGLIVFGKSKVWLLK